MRVYIRLLFSGRLGLTMNSHHHLINQSPSRGSPLQELELPLELPLAHQASSHHLFKLLDFKVTTPELLLIT